MQKQFETWLRAYQAKDGISERTAGARLGCGREIYRTVCRLKMMPSIATVQKIADTRGVRVSDIFREVEDTPIAQ